MSLDPWLDQYRNHPVWQTLDQLGDLLEGAPERTTTDEQNDFDRISWVASYLKEQRGEPTALVSGSSLSQLQQNLAQVVAGVSNWRSGAGSQHLATAARPQLDGVLDALRGWPTAKDRYAKGTLRAGKDFIQQAEDELAKLKQQIAQANDALTGLSNAASEDRAEAERQLSELQQRITSSTTTIDGQISRLDSALNGLQQNFAEAESARAAAHQEAVSAQATASQDLLTGVRDKAEQQRRELAQRGEEFIQDLAALKEQAVRLVDAVGLTGTATEYGKYAEQERGAADMWRWIAAGSFGSSFILFLVVVWLTHVDGGTPWQLIVFRFGASLALLALGAYAAHESTEHRTEERRAKSIQLDLAAIDPFIVNLPEEDKQKIRSAAATRLFTTSRPPRARKPRSESPELTPAVLQELAAALVPYLGKQ